MKTSKRPKDKKISRKKFPWRKNQKKWTDTLFAKKLLKNPSLMTNSELATALEECMMWWLARGKYDWQEDPVSEGKEDECPFSSGVLKNIFYETIARMKISGDIAMGRFK